jgi:hypothetical protein
MSESVGPQREAGAVGLAPDRLDLERIASRETAREHVLDHRRDDRGAEGRA